MPLYLQPFFEKNSPWDYFTIKRKEMNYSDYQKYMKVLNSTIEETERRIENLDNQKLISQLSYDEWVKFQSGELSINQIKRDKQINKIV